MPFLSTPSVWNNFSQGSLSLRPKGNILPDSLGNLYFPTGQGVGKYVIATDTLTFIDTSDGLVSNDIKDLAVDSNDDLWVLKNQSTNSNPAQVVLQKYDTGLNSVVLAVDQQTLFGVKSNYGTTQFVSINPFSGHVFVGEGNVGGPPAGGILAFFDGIGWTAILDTTVGFIIGSSFELIQFETADRWWIGRDGGGPSVVLYDNSITLNIFSFTDTSFGGSSVRGIQLLSSGRLIVVTVGNIHRIDSGTPSDTGVGVGVMFTSFLGLGELVWGHNGPTTGPAGGITIASYNDVTTSRENFSRTTVGGDSSGGSHAEGHDLDGNVWFMRGPASVASLSQGVLATVPVFTTLEVRTLTDTTIDFRVEVDANATVFVVIVPVTDPAPSTDQVIAGQDFNSDPVPAGFADSDVLLANVENSAGGLKVINLVVGVANAAYVVASGSGGNQSTPTPVNISPPLTSVILEEITTGGQFSGVLIV